MTILEARNNEHSEPGEEREPILDPRELSELIFTHLHGGISELLDKLPTSSTRRGPGHDETTTTYSSGGYVLDRTRRVTQQEDDTSSRIRVIPASLASELTDPDTDDRRIRADLMVFEVSTLGRPQLTLNERTADETERVQTSISVSDGTLGQCHISLFPQTTTFMDDVGGRYEKQIVESIKRPAEPPFNGIEQDLVARSMDRIIGFTVPLIDDLQQAVNRQVPTNRNE